LNSIFYVLILDNKMEITNFEVYQSSSLIQNNNQTGLDTLVENVETTPKVVEPKNLIHLKKKNDSLFNCFICTSRKSSKNKEKKTSPSSIVEIVSEKSEKGIEEVRTVQKVQNEDESEENNNLNLDEEKNNNSSSSNEDKKFDIKGAIIREGTSIVTDFTDSLEYTAHHDETTITVINDSDEKNSVVIKAEEEVEAAAAAQTETAQGQAKTEEEEEKEEDYKELEVEINSSGEQLKDMNNNNIDSFQTTTITTADETSKTQTVSTQTINAPLYDTKKKSKFSPIINLFRSNKKNKFNREEYLSHLNILKTSEAEVAVASKETQTINNLTNIDTDSQNKTNESQQTNDTTAQTFNSTMTTTTTTTTLHTNEDKTIQKTPIIRKMNESKQFQGIRLNFDNENSNNNKETNNVFKSSETTPKIVINTQQQNETNLNNDERIPKNGSSFILIEFPQSETIETENGQEEVKVKYTYENLGYSMKHQNTTSIATQTDIVAIDLNKYLREDSTITIDGTTNKNKDLFFNIVNLSSVQSEQDPAASSSQKMYKIEDFIEDESHLMNKHRTTTKATTTTATSTVQRTQNLSSFYLLNNNMKMEERYIPNGIPLQQLFGLTTEQYEDYNDGYVPFERFRDEKVRKLNKDDKNLLINKRMLAIDYLMSNSGYRPFSTLHTDSKTFQNAENVEKVAFKGFTHCISYVTRDDNAKEIMYSDLYNKMSKKISSSKKFKYHIKNVLEHFRFEYQNEDRLIEQLRYGNKISMKQNVDTELAKVAAQAMTLATNSINENISKKNLTLLRRHSSYLTWREANERARILFYKDKGPEIHYNPNRNSFRVSMLTSLDNNNNNTKVTRISVTDNDIREILNVSGLFWDGKRISVIGEEEKDGETGGELQNQKDPKKEAFKVVESLQS
jgi:hypothetical protein